MQQNVIIFILLFLTEMSQKVFHTLVPSFMVVCWMVQKLKKKPKSWSESNPFTSYDYNSTFIAIPLQFSEFFLESSYLELVWETACLL